jgi:hypothetical protein
VSSQTPYNINLPLFIIKEFKEIYSEKSAYYLFKLAEEINIQVSNEKLIDRLDDLRL